MIDVENSFKRFKALKELAKNNKGYIEPTLYESEIETIIQALEKQIPKKPYIQQIEVDYYEHDCYECPNCDSFLGYVLECKEEHYQNNYCPECGQKIDWSKVEE